MLNFEYFCGGICETNGFFVEFDGQEVVFDAPDGMCRWLREKSARPERLFLTHQHFDHTYDAAAIKEEFALEVVAWTEWNDDLALIPFLPSPFRESVVPCQIDTILETNNSAEIEIFRGVFAHVHFVPGHSPDSILFHFHEQSLAISGDILFDMGYGRTDLPHGDQSLLFEGIRQKVFTLPDDTQFFPGHGERFFLHDRKSFGI